MPSPDPPSSDAAALVPAKDWPRIRAEMVRFACRLARSRGAADELVQEAVARVIDRERDPWDPETEPLLAKHMMRIIENIARGNRAKVAVRRDPRNVAAVEERTIRRPESPEDAALGAEGEREARGTLDEVKAELAGDAPALEVVDLSERGVDRPADQAAATGRPIEEIRNARRRVRRAIEEVLRRRQEAPPAREAP
jgi:DNA-directed RNA polymerase specialized sigma24 family protein